MLCETKHFSSNIMRSETHSSTRKSEFWPRLMRSPFRSKKGRSKKKDMEEEEEEEGLRKKLNLNEEYKQVFRSKSYVDIWSRVQVQLKGSPPISHKRSSSLSSSSSSLSASCPLSSFSNSPFISYPITRYTHLPNCLLEPRQEVVLESIKSSRLQVLLKDYFEVTLEAYNLCELLLRGIHKTRSNHRIIKRVLTLSAEGETTDYEMLIQELAFFARLSNPLSFINNGTVEFPSIHDKHAILLQKLTSRRRRIKRRGKFIKFYKKVAGYSFLIVYTALAIALLSLALHSVVGLLGVPGLILPFSTGVLKKVDCESLKPSALERMEAQVDITAKGAYILINDFDTMARLTARVHDEVEHQRAVSQMCVRNSESSEVVKEAIRELRMHEGRFMEQLEELEEHVYLCFLTINRSRRLVVDEILA